MDEFLKMLMEATKNGDTKVEVHRVDKEDLKKMFGQKDESSDYVAEAVEIAHLNKVMYDAHIGQGFTAEEALALTIAVINN